MNNLPPGVSASMIPGNRPEDDAYEMLLNALASAVTRLAFLNTEEAKHYSADNSAWVKEGRAALRANDADVADSDLPK